jgi:DNA-binding GntR family transcriptional regulator
VNASDVRAAYEQIADDLRTRIMSGELPPGTRLPPQKELAGSYEVAVETLRKALDVLAREGVVASRSTRGTFVIKAPDEPEPSPGYRGIVELLGQLDERLAAVEEFVRRAEQRGRQGGR